MMASFRDYDNQWFHESVYESELLDILKKEYVCDRAQTLISLTDNNEMYGFPVIALRSNSRLGRTRCLADVKDRIWHLIQNDDSILGIRDCLGLAPLHLICSLHSPGQMKILKILCTQRTSDVNTLDSLSRTPLHHALSPANLKYHSECNDSGESLVDIVTLLIEHGANVNAMECHGITPLHLALDYYRSGNSSRLQEYSNLIRTLLMAGASTDLKSPSGNRPLSLTPLHLACRLRGRSSLDVLSLLVTHDNVNTTDHMRSTPLHELLSVEEKAIQGKDRHYFSPSCNFILDKVGVLLKYGADVNAKDNQDMTALLTVLNNPNNDYCAPIVKLLLERGANPNVTIPHNRISPLHLACKHFGDELLELVPLFLKGGARINARDYKIMTPFHYALSPSSNATRVLSVFNLRSLVRFGADPTLNDAHENNSIHMVCVSPIRNLKSIVSFLISEGCKLNHRNKQDNTPLLHFLSNNFDKKSIQTLINLGADCSVQNREGISPLHLVARSLEYHDDVDEIVEIILKGGAKVNVRDCYGNTPLHYAVRDDCTINMKAIRKLLLAGADPNIANSSGKTPFHVVCSVGNYYLAKMLLEFGADVNKKDADSDTPLHIAQAASENASSISRLLLENGAHLAATNSRNATPFIIMSLNTCHFMIGYTVLLVASGRYTLNDKENKLLDHNSVFRKWYNNCFSCVTSMATHFIGNSSVTLLEFLLADNKRAVRYIRNPDILFELTGLADSATYRWYSTMIKEKMSGLVFLKTLLDRTSRSLKIISSPYQFPDIVTDKILSFLYEDDMNSLNRAIFSAVRIFMDE